MLQQDYPLSFYEERREGARRSAEVVVPLILDLLAVRSVVDVGCGDGSWLAAFQAFGVQDVLGLDGDYVSRDVLQVRQEFFQSCDLGKPFLLGRTFDLAVSLEVAEHLPSECAKGFVQSLTRLAPLVLFSAAIPFQSGCNHVNEQWPDEWTRLFEDQGYVVIDFVRKRIWNNEAVDWWYAQNTLLFARTELIENSARLRAELEQTNKSQLCLVHPRQYLSLRARIPSPPPTPSWGVIGASRLLMSALANAFRKRVRLLVARGTRL
jgi:SAM-dependent methyltransferase